ncbi:hypothetical protein FRC17_004026 [Serendipita sp. 399]|nr:hypothetical protein FRC17_004026 [Serendipita sp. 399]
MPAQRTKDAQSTKEDEIGPGFFRCSICGHQGKSAKGGLEKHKKSSQKCKAIAAGTRVEVTHPYKVDSIHKNVTRTPAGGVLDNEIEGLEELRDLFAVHLAYEYTSYPAEVDVHSSSEEEDAQSPKPIPDVIVSFDPPPPSLDSCGLYIQRHLYASSPVSTKCELPPIPVHWPFRTYEDYRQAEILLEAGSSSQIIDKQLALVQSVQADGGPVTLKNAKELYRTLDKASLGDAEKFTDTRVRTTFNGKQYLHNLYSRDLLLVIREILRDPSLKDMLTFDAERHYIARPGGGIMRLYQEYHHGDDMWSLQASRLFLSSSLKLRNSVWTTGADRS